MFGAKDSGKKRKNREASQRLAEPAVDPKPGATAAPVSSSPESGLSIEDYANKHDLSEAEVWRKLRRGELLGRTQQGHLLVFGSSEQAPAPEPARAAATAAAPAVGTHSAAAAPDLPPGPEPDATIDDLTFLPPLPGQAPAGSFLALSGEKTSSSPELALLIDHLSLAKEENREILRMTQDSIKKISDMSDAMLEMKDRVIDAREAELLALKDQLASREAELKKLKQQNEDLEMLARTMASTPQR